MRQIIDEAKVVCSKAAAEVAQLVQKKPNAVIALTAVDMPEAFFDALSKSGVSFAETTFCNACELSGEAGEGAFSQQTKLRALLYDTVSPKAVLLPTAEDYEDAIRAAGGLDLVVLGLGERGHIAYNEPGVDFGAGMHENKLADVTRKALEAEMGDPDAVPTHGITMGIATILAAKRVLLIAVGADKANAAQKTLEGRPETFIPASFLQLHTDVTVYLDHDAASKL